MKKNRRAFAALVLLWPVLAQADSPEFGAVVLEVTPNVRHAFVSAQAQSSNAAIVSKNEWNAAHNAPTYRACSTPSGVIWISQPVGLTAFAGASSLYCRINLTNAASVRVVVPVLAAGAASAVIRAQYTTDTTCASGWDYLDGASGPSVSISSTGIKASSLISLATAAKADVCLRFVGLAP